MDQLAGVICHHSLLFFIQGGPGVPGQGLRGQVESSVLLAVKVINSHIPYIKQQRHPPQN
jgi:hypothetical protein